MVIDERSRHRMYERLQQVLGEEEAATLMEHLPPVGWADVATKSDLAALRTELELKLESLEHRLLATFRAELGNQTRTMISAMIFSTSTAVVAVGSIAVAAVRF
jgi:hypothetical protein